MEGHGAPGAGRLVHVETHHKLVASVWNQALNRHTLRDAAEEKRPELQPAARQSGAITGEISAPLLVPVKRFSRLDVADGRGVVGPHGRAADCVAD